MKVRFRLGPFTFGKSGTRLSLWSGGTGFIDHYSIQYIMYILAGKIEHTYD